jgi:hypothetical protein
MKHRATVVILVVWFGVVLELAARGAFVSVPGEAPAAVGIGFGGPIAAFGIAAWASGRFRDYVRSLPPLLLATSHGWRFVGLGFLMAYAEGLLPASFAWTAGPGDIAMAVTAPWICLQIARDANFLSSRVFRFWNYFGIFDFLLAMVIGILNQGVLPAFHPVISAALMQRLPFVLIPCFFVPLLFIDHIVLLMKPVSTVNRGR